MHLVKSSSGDIIRLYGWTIVMAGVPLRVIWRCLCLSVSAGDAPKYQAKVYPRADALNGITTCLNNTLPYYIQRRTIIVRFLRRNQPFVVILGLAMSRLFRDTSSAGLITDTSLWILLYSRRARFSTHPDSRIWRVVGQFSGLNEASAVACRMLHIFHTITKVGQTLRRKLPRFRSAGFYAQFLGHAHNPQHFTVSIKPQ